jgi:hypothetical protein
MQESRRFRAALAGVGRPLTGPFAPKLCALCLVSGLGLGCGDQEQERSLPPLQVGMTSAVPPIYDDGQLTIYEVKRGIQFPILAPSEQIRGQLNAQQVAPYGRRPWVTPDDVRVQVTWTLSNLDDEPHVVEVLVDPWNEFGRYYPGLQLTDADNQEYMPNFSGIDQRYIALGKGEGAASRVHGTYTFEDLEEVAVDLATVMRLIQEPPAAEGGEGEDQRVSYANHAFHWQNRSFNDLLVAYWVPDVVAGLTGLDIGFRTYEPANVAIEVAVEVVDVEGDRLRQPDEDHPLLPAANQVITVGVAP